MSILSDIDAMAELLVKNELIRIRPAEPCKQCLPGSPCYWHRDAKPTEQRSAA